MGEFGRPTGTGKSETLKFSAGEISKTVNVDVLGDKADENDETFAVKVSNLRGAKFSDNQSELSRTVTILDNDGQSIRIDAPSVKEGNAGFTNLIYTVSLSGAEASAVTFDYKTESDTANADADFVNTSGKLTIPAGSLSGKISIPIIGDKIIESNEAVKLTLTNASGIKLKSNALPLTASGTIIEDDFSVVSLSSNTAVYAPGSGIKRLDVAVSFNIPLKLDSVITYRTQSDTAQENNDFLPVSSTLTLAAGATGGVISIPIAANSPGETDESFKLIIDGVSGGAQFADGVTSLTSTITIKNLTLPALSIQNIQIAEGDSGSKSLVFQAALSEAAPQDISFTAKTVDISAKATTDYVALNKQFTILKGSKAVDIAVAILGDKDNEGDESFTLELSDLSTAVFENADVTYSVTGKIIDDDKPIMRVDDPKVVEGDTGVKEAKVKVSLSAEASSPVTVRYKTLDGTARSGEDYVETEDVLTIPKGAKSGEILVNVIGDTSPEASQNFYVVLSDPTNAQFINLTSKLESTVTILSDDGDSLPTVSVSQAVAAYEGNADITDVKVSLKLSKAATKTLSLRYETRSGEAIAGSDFEAKDGVVTFLSGDTEATITLSVYGDPESEEDEAFLLVLTDPVNLQFGAEASKEISITIQDDDSEPPQTLEGTAKGDKLSVFDQGDGLGDDTINGLAGADTMTGGDGNDTYYVDNAKDVIIEEDQSESAAGDEDWVILTAASYTLAANVERVRVEGKAAASVTGNGLDNSFIGNSGANTFVGLGGNDTFDGGSGKDVLTGGEGEDVFQFTSGVKGGKNVDTIRDFVSGEDKIYLSGAIFTKVAEAINFTVGDEPTEIDADLFLSGSKVKATSSSSYLLYDTKTGRLSYDADGSGKGAADWFLTLVGKPILTAEDFYVL